ncbi:hypothetical protein [Oryza sativa Japonica Group]|uniref:Uncharacterized protein n=1 Tax=Oryza sativa subsp. japonica TaxID=39947 RepID=Q5QMG8_ORYSJ|nr:hypothetical protein [Oryza sativa Japonica Group]
MGMRAEYYPISSLVLSASTAEAAAMGVDDGGGDLSDEEVDAAPASWYEAKATSRQQLRVQGKTMEPYYCGNRTSRSCKEGAPSTSQLECTDGQRLKNRSELDGPADKLDDLERSRGR